MRYHNTIHNILPYKAIAIGISNITTLRYIDHDYDFALAMLTSIMVPHQPMLQLRVESDKSAVDLELTLPGLQLHDIMRSCSYRQSPLVIHAG